MKTKPSTTLRALVALALLSVLTFQPTDTFAQGTAFTYQGRLNDGAGPANGSYDLTFALFSTVSGAGQVGTPQTNLATALAGGLFTVTLDFGNQFPGDGRWIEMGVRTNGGVFTLLSPRQKISAVPYAVTASNLSGTLPDARLAGTYSGALTLNNTANNFTGSGAGLTALNAAQLTSGTVPSARFAGLYSSALTLNNAANSFTGNGASLTALNASQLTSGTVPGARLAGTYSSAVTLNNVANIYSGSGVGLTALNAAQLTSGTVPSARLAGTYSSALTLSSAANSFMGNGAGLTALNASQLTSGTVPDAALAGNIALLNVAQTFTADKSFATGAQLLADLGSRSAPGLAFVGDPNTGIFSPAANTVAIVTAGLERMRVDSSGRVGIGTTNPPNRLTVAGAGGFSADGAAAIMLDNTAAGGHAWVLTAQDDGKLRLLDRTTLGDHLLIDTNGHVGLGTITPATPLHVDGGSDASLSGGGYIMTGSLFGQNIVIDSNEIMARDGQQRADLYLNRGSGDVFIGTGAFLLPETDDSQILGASNKRWSTVWAANGSIQTSDVRFKDHIQPVSYGLQTVLALRPVSFQWKKATDERVYLGLIAQEVDPLVPEAVVKDANPEHPLGMNYSAFIPVLIKAIQDQQPLMDAQQAEQKQLQARLEKLEQAFARGQDGGTK